MYKIIFVQGSGVINNFPLLKMNNYSVFYPGISYCRLNLNDCSEYKPLFQISFQRGCNGFYKVGYIFSGRNAMGQQ